MKVEGGVDLLLAMLYAGGNRKAVNEEIMGNTRLDKLLFLIEMETSLAKYLKDFAFVPYNFGPYSPEVFDALQALKNARLVKEEEIELESYLDEADRYENEVEAAENETTPKATKVYSLTDDGLKVGQILFDSLSESERQQLTEIKRKFNSLSLRKLIQYVYRKYPKYATESLIKDYAY